jgi:predicted GIY-YIG superfamily endonuclease
MIVYVLQCEKGMFYVGKTNKKLEYRFNEHLINSKCSITSKYKPIRIVFSKKTYNIFEEDTLVKIYMLKYGIHNVRGGFYSSLNLSKLDIIRLKNEIFSYIGGCFKCGREIHFDNKCHAKTDIFGDNIYKKSLNATNRNSKNNVENKYREESKTITKSPFNCFL